MSKDRKQNIIEAQHEAKTNKLLGPGHFFLPCKTTLSISSYRSAEVFSLESLIEYLQEWQTKAKGPVTISIQGKYDGNSCYLQRDEHGNFYVFTEDGSEVTERFPRMIELAKNTLPQNDFIIIGEVEKWLKEDGKYVHQGREVVAGELHSRSEKPQDEYYVWNFHDCVWFMGEDIHMQNYSDRYAILEKKFSFKYSLLERMNPGSLNLVPNFICKTDEQVKKAVNKLMAIDNLEGAMVKRWDGFPYELDGRSNQVVKFKKYAEAHVLVVDRRLIQGSDQTYQYKVAVEVLPTEMDEVDEKLVQDFKDMKIMTVADTFNTNVEAEVGDVLTVKFHNLFVHENEEGKYKLALYEPRVYENRTVANPKEMPDTVTTLMKIGTDARLIVFKGLHCNRFLPFELVKQLDTFEQYPKEGQTYKFIIHHHWRGKSTHGDLRISHIGGEYLLGYTLNIMTPGEVKDPVLKMEDAIKWSHKPELWKFDVKTGKFQSRQTRGGLKKATSIVVELKEPEPIEWLSFEGVVPPGNVGSTTQYPGVFYIACKGDAEYGFRNGYFHEYWLRVPEWENGGQRLVFRQLSSDFSASLPISKFLQIAFDADEPITVYIVDRDSISCKLGDILLPDSAVIDFDETISFGKTLPPADTPEIRTPTMWMLIKPNDSIPYILSTRAVKKGRITPFGASALPKSIKSQIPDEFAYWNVKDEATRIKVRDGLVEAIKHRQVKVDFETTFKSMDLFKALDWKSIHCGTISKDEIKQYCTQPAWQDLRIELKGKTLEEKFNLLKDWLKKHNNSRAAQVQVTNYINALARGGMVSLKANVNRKFVLNKRTWRGPIHVRIGYSAELYDLWIDNGKEVYLWTFSSNPIHFESTTGTFEQIHNKKLMNTLGQLPPGTELNPNKQIPVTIERVTEGELLMLLDDPTTKKFQVKEKEWKGLYLLVQDDNTNIWTLHTTADVGEKE
jgi:hypothetical protein